MINHYNDLAANERTYLSWLRTALALIAFGFLLEKFHLFMMTVEMSFGAKDPSTIGPLEHKGGIALVAIGLITIVMASVRFFRTARLLQSDAQEEYHTRGILVLAVLFILIAIFALLLALRMLS